MFGILQMLKTMKTIKQFLFKAAVFTVATFFFVFGASALTSSGIDQAVADVSSFADTAFNLIIAIGSLIGLIGSVRVYIEWQGADQNTRKAIMRWFGACLFLILVSVIIKAFFT
jgi:cytochrome c biogenesis factor